MNLLHISSSPRGTDSESLRIAKVFTDTYAESHPGAVVDHWDLWDAPLPDMALGAKAKMTVFGGGTPVGAGGPRVGAGPRGVRPVRRGRPGAVQRADVERRASRTCSSSSSTW